MRLAYQGERGAFGEAACRCRDAAAERVAFATVAAAIAAVRAGECDAAVLPVESSVAGPVRAVLDLIPGSGLVQVGEVRLPIRMALIGAPGATIAGLETLVSHPVALAQCSKLVARLGLRVEAAANTAIAAARLAANPDPATGVLASAEAARIHRLDLILDDVGDDPAAVTRFAVLANGPRAKRSPGPLARKGGGRA